MVSDRVEQVRVCSEGEWKSGIPVTEAQKALVSHLVWLDQECERRRETDEIGEGTRARSCRTFKILDFILPRGHGDSLEVSGKGVRIWS